MIAKRKVCLILSVIAVAVVAVVLLRRPVRPPADAVAAGDVSAPKPVSAPGRIRTVSPEAGRGESTAAEPEVADAEAEGETLSAEEKAEAAAEAKVEAFDALTDKWMEPSAAGVAMRDVEAFAKAFRDVPADRRDECVHRALNLIPDENVMLLVGILMDKTMDRETVETVFNDILNRDEDVKQPVMKQIYGDKTHPCWADVAWILDVTGGPSAAPSAPAQ